MEGNQTSNEEINPSMNGFNEESPQEPTLIKEEIESNEDIVELSKEIQKPKKPRTQKQIDALKKAQETRRQNILKKKQMKQEQLDTIESNENEVLEKPEKVKSNRRRQKIVYEDDPSSDEEVIVVKRRGRPRKKKIVYQDESSDEEYIVPKPKPRRKKKAPPPQEESSDESSDSDYEQDKEYSYQINRPLKYSDVFRFS